MKKYILFFFVIVSGISFSQKLNVYKYALVPEKFEFLQEKNQYQLNDLTKAGMKKYGFESFFTTEILPTDITNENKVYVDVLDNSSMIYTKLIIVLRDYTNNILFQSSEGKSKEKDFAEAYEECFRQAIKSFDVLKHQYNPTQVNDIEIKSIEYQNINSVLTSYTADKTSNGFKLFDGNQILRFLIYVTSNPNVFILNTTGCKRQTGVLIHKQNDSYSLEYYTDEKLIKETMNILF